MKGPTVTGRTFYLRGDYDMLNASELEDLLLCFAHGGGRGALTVDAGQLRFIDSSGIGVLLRVRNAMEAAGCTFRVVNLPAGIRRVVEVLGLIDILGVEAN